MTDPELLKLAESSRAWPFEEARKVRKRVDRNPPAKGHVLFQTGYGPSGLPHIGTFGEVARTTMVRRAFEILCDIPTRLICFSDDMDGLRKIPDNVPLRDDLKQDLHLPLTKVRDPFGTHEGFAQHNNAQLRKFLDQFGFDYEFASSTDYYKSGRFDEMLLTALERFDRIMEVMLPTLGPDRQKTYSPFLPISPRTGHVLQVPTLERNLRRGTIVYAEPDGEKVEVPVTGGHVKMQWKPDWALRWAALGVDYEMSGKDLIESVTQSTRICRVLGSKPPVSFSYELFNDEKGQKISKSKGNGLAIEEWLRFASPESLSYFMYLKPRVAKRLHVGIVPKTVDDYHRHLAAFPEQDLGQRLDNPVWHVHGGNPPLSDMVLPYSMLLNLASASAADSKTTLWEFIRKYAPEVDPATHAGVDEAAEHAVQYYNDIDRPQKMFRLPSPKEHDALKSLSDRLRGFDGSADAETFQSVVYAVGREHEFEPLRDWFKAIYEVLLGASAGPRFGGFITAYGVTETISLIDAGLSGRLVEDSRSPVQEVVG